MKEIKLTIPEGCKTVTVKMDGEQVITEFEPKDEKWTPKDGDFIAYEMNLMGLYVYLFRRLDLGPTHNGYITLMGRDICLNETVDRFAEQIREIFKNSKAE